MSTRFESGSGRRQVLMGMAGLAAAGLSGLGHAQAERYPSRMIKYVFPYAPGFLPELFGR